MNGNIENYSRRGTPVLAGAFRILSGITGIIAGLYLAASPEIQGHGLGFLLIIGSPFVILTDER